MLSEPALSVALPTVRVRAPGKAMIVGEYAVLDGSPAVVAAIDCFADAVLPADTNSGTSAFVMAAQSHARTTLQAAGVALASSYADRLPQIDTSSFSREGRKLGLGSSAAATVAAVGCWYAAAGLDLESDPVRRDLAAAARSAHDDAQGVRGSGSDILAATWGGLRVVNERTDAQSPARLQLPAGLCLRLIATTESASTAQLVARYREAGDATRAARQQLAQAARAFIAACQAAESHAALQSFDQALQGYVQLGDAIGSPLATADHLAIAKVVKSLGGAAKPSGAGGGDLAVALLPCDIRPQQLAQSLPSELWLLPLAISERGIHPLSNLPAA